VEGGGVTGVEPDDWYKRLTVNGMRLIPSEWAEHTRQIVFIDEIAWLEFGAGVDTAGWPLRDAPEGTL
jgi:hypothetical protein